MDYLKNLLKRVNKDGKLEGQPVDGNGNEYREFVYTSAVVTVDNINNVDATASWWYRNDSPCGCCHRNKQHHDNIGI